MRDELLVWSQLMIYIWLQDNYTDPAIALLIYSYLSRHGCQLMVEYVVNITDSEHDIAHVTDLLGWDNFFISDIPKSQPTGLLLAVTPGLLVLSNISC